MVGRSESRVAGALRCFYAGTPKPFPAALLNWHVIYTAGPFPVEHRKLWLPQKVMTSVRWLAPSSVVLPCTPKPAWWSQGAGVADQCRRFQFLTGSCVSTRITRRGHRRSNRPCFHWTSPHCAAVLWWQKSHLAFFRYDTQRLRMR